MQRAKRYALITGTLLMMVGCSVAGGSGSTSSYSSSDTLTLQEIRDAHTSTAFDVVRKLRPMWLQTRGRETINNPSEIAVYLDGIRSGGPAFLETIPSSAVTSMRYIDAATATQRWGTNHVHGAIMVSTRP